MKFTPLWISRSITNGGVRPDGCNSGLLDDNKVSELCPNVAEGDYCTAVRVSEKTVFAHGAEWNKPINADTVGEGIEEVCGPSSTSGSGSCTFEKLELPVNVWNTGKMPTSVSNSRCNFGPACGYFTGATLEYTMLGLWGDEGSRRVLAATVVQALKVATKPSGSWTNIGEYFKSLWGDSFFDPSAVLHRCVAGMAVVAGHRASSFVSVRGKHIATPGKCVTGSARSPCLTSAY
mgnify:FL=1